MDLTFQRSLLQQVADLHAVRSTSLATEIHRQSTATYLDAGRLGLEIKRLFQDRPLIAGLSCDLPSAGSYFTVELASVPVLVVRSEDGQVSAFLNACRHRGARVAEGRGSPGRIFKCPYHAWIYDINGRLMGQPAGNDYFQGVDPAQTGLIPLRATEAHGLILVQPTTGSGEVDVHAAVDGLGKELSGHGFERFAFLAENHSTWTMNWKQPYETFLEAYHIFSLHRTTLAKEILSTPMLTEVFGPHGRGVLMGRGAVEMFKRDAADWSFKGTTNLVYWLFPNTVLSMPMTGHAELWQFYPCDDRADRTRVHVRFYTPSAVETDKEKAFWQRMIDFTMNVVTTEDFAQQERVFANMRSGLLPELIFGRNEPALVNYHRAIEEALAEA